MMTEKTVAGPDAFLRKTDGRMIHPATARNLDPICELVQTWAPGKGRALELASGGGQHVVALAQRMPGLTWQPTDLEHDRLTSIDTLATEAELPNIRPAVELDATQPGWNRSMGGRDLILTVNLFHLISRTEADTLIEEVAAALHHGGTFILYGPFKRDGKLVSANDQAFDAELRATDPEIGYKNDGDVRSMLHANWLELISVVEMPANNLAFIARKG